MDSLTEIISKSLNMLEYEKLKRYLYKIYICQLINADINGAINLFRKVVDDSILELRTDSGLVNRSHRLRLSVESTDFKC